MGEVGPITYFTEAALLWLAGTLIGEVGVHTIPRRQHYCSWLAVIWARSGLIICYTKPALLSMAGTVMGEVVAHDIFNRASITVF